MRVTGYEALRAHAAWLDLSARGKIRVTGEDRARLLHAMSTNHVADLAPGEQTYTFFLNSQGRILCDAYIYAFADHFFLDTEPETGAKLLAHLDQYVIADDVTLEDVTNEWGCMGIEGPEAEAFARGISIPEPAFVRHAAVTAKSGVRIFFPRSESLTMPYLPDASDADIKIVRLEHGIPRYGEDISERYLVQETQAMHAVHPNKGCYLGQEIVERVRSRAQIHRLLMPVRIKSEKAVDPGTKLTADGKPAAEITSAAYSPAFGEVVALAYVRVEAAQSKPPLLVADSDPPIAAYIP